MTDSIDTSEREAEEPRGPFNLPIREMRAEPVPHQPADPLRAALQLALEATPEQLPTALGALAEQPAVAAAMARGAGPRITPAQAMDTLKEAFAADPSYAWTWHCGVWAAAHDEGMETSAANRAAARLMSMAFDVDTSKHENFAATQAAAPTPEATQPDDTKMWAVHIIGPDDVHAVPNREIADAACVALNWSFKRQKLADMCRAEVIEWTHGYETWAAEKDLFRLEAVPSAEATQPTQAQAPSEREALELAQEALEWHASACGEGCIPDGTVAALTAIRAALATQQAGTELIATLAEAKAVIPVASPPGNGGDGEYTLTFYFRTWDALTAANVAWTQRGSTQQAVQAEPKSDDVDRLLREVFALCEATEDAPDVDPKNEHQRGFDKGRRFEAKQIRRTIGDWFQAEFCGRSFMGEPVIATPPAPGQVERDREDERGVANVASFDEFTEASDHCLLASEQDLRHQAKALHEFALPALRWAEAQMNKQRDDVSLLDWLDAKNKPFKMGWQVGVAPAGNVVVKSVIYPITEPVSIRSAIRAARSSEGGGNV